MDSTLHILRGLRENVSQSEKYATKLLSTVKLVAKMYKKGTLLSLSILMPTTSPVEPVVVVTPEKLVADSEKIREKLYGNAFQEVQKISTEERMAAKDAIVKNLSEALSKDEDFVKWCVKKNNEHMKTFGNIDKSQLPFDDIPTQEPVKLTVSDMVQWGVNNLVHTWAQTSSDSNSIAIFLQRKAKEIFNLDGATTEHLSPTKEDYPELKRQEDELQKRMVELIYKYRHEEGTEEEGQAIVKEQEEILVKQKALRDKMHYANLVPETAPEDGEQFTKFLRAQYDATQKYLKEAGITKIRLYRGMKQIPYVPSPETEKFMHEVDALYAECGKAGDALSQAINNKEVDRVPELKKVREELSVRQAALAKELLDKLVVESSAVDSKIKLQPLGSFSTSYDIASKFATPDINSLVMSIEVPAKYIFSTCRTGVGCLSEGEVVVLGHETTTHVRRNFKWNLEIHRPRIRNEQEFLEYVGLTDEAFELSKRRVQRSG